MKQLTCEMCGSTDLVKQDGVFVCQSCGTRYKEDYAVIISERDYSPISEIKERIRKNHEIEIPDNMSVEELLSAVEDAYNSTMSNSNIVALQYCQKAFALAPKRYEVIMWYTIVILKTSVLDDYKLLNKLKTLLGNCPDDEKNKLRTNITLLVEKRLSEMIRLKCDHFSFANEIAAALEDTQKIIKEFTQHLQISFGEYTNEHFQIIINTVQKRWDSVVNDYNSAKYGKPDQFLFEKVITEGDELEELLNKALQMYDGNISMQVQAYMLMISILKFQNSACSWKTKIQSRTSFYDGSREYRDVWVKEFTVSETKRNENNQRINKYTEKIREIDPSYTIPQLDSNMNTTTGCYIATCVYGSYDCPQVWTLRRYRDNTLGITWYGRVFIRVYYAISPTLVKWFGKTSWFKKMWQGWLDSIVAKLNGIGVENTPYQDKEW